MFTDDCKNNRLYGGFNPVYARRIWRKRNPSASLNEQDMAQRQAAKNAADRARLDAIMEQRDKRPAFARDRDIPQWAYAIIWDAALAHGVPIEEILGHTRAAHVVRARHQAMYELKRKHDRLSAPRIGKWFGRDHTAVMYGAEKHAFITQLPRVFGFDAAGKMRRNRIWHTQRREICGEA